MELEKLREFGERMLKVGFLGAKGCITEFKMMCLSGAVDPLTGPLSSKEAWGAWWPNMAYPATQGVVWAWIEEMAGCELELCKEWGAKEYSATPADDEEFEDFVVEASNRIEAIVLIAEEMKRRKDEEDRKNREPEFKRLDRIQHNDGRKATFLSFESDVFWVIEDNDDMPRQFLMSFLNLWKLIPQEQPKPHLPTKLAPWVWVEIKGTYIKGMVYSFSGDENGFWRVIYTNGREMIKRFHESELTIIPPPGLP